MRRWVPSLVVLGLGAACGDKEAAEPEPEPPTCDPERVPVVMVHGFLESGALWLPFGQRFAGNGYCGDAILAFDWDPLDDDTDHVAALDAFIDEARTASGAAVVDLVAHSAGGELAYDYLADPRRAAKVQSYCHLASAARPGPPGPEGAPLPMANIRSPADPIVPGGDIPGATNLTLTTEDHLQVATSDKAFTAVYLFLGAGQRPQTIARTDAPPADVTKSRTISGRAMTFGENRPLSGWQVDIYATAPDTGARLAEAPDQSFTTSSNGAWGPFSAKPETTYEFHLHGPLSTDVPVHHYREPFVADSNLVHLFGHPSPDSLLRVMWSGIDRKDAHAALILQFASQAIQSERDGLAVNARELATEALARAERSTTTFLVYDDKADGKSGAEIDDLEDLFERSIAGVDEVLPVGSTIRIRFGTRVLNAPAWPSQSDGITYATFD